MSAVAEAPAVVFTKAVDAVKDAHVAMPVSTSSIVFNVDYQKFIEHGAQHLDDEDAKIVESRRQSPRRSLRDIERELKSGK
jgi:hypothetical protein